MNRIVSCAALFGLLCLMGACSSSRPEITSATISDEHPVVGQRLLLRVYAQSDNPPLRYIWNGSGIFQSTDKDLRAGEPTERYYVYWIPTGEGTRTVSCTVIDDEDNEETYHFSVNVRHRTLKELQSSDLVIMAKDPKSLTGGILAGIRGHDFVYYTAVETSDYKWGESEFNWDEIADPLDAMTMTTSSVSYLYSITSVWAVHQETPGDWELVSRGSSSDTSRDTPFADDGVGAVNTIGVNGAQIWVGTDKGLYLYSTTGDGWADEPVELVQGNPHAVVNDIYTANDCVYVATEAGIFFTEDNGGTWERFDGTGDTKAITGYHDISLDTVTIYALTEESEGSATYTIRCYRDDGAEVLAEPGYPPDSYAWIEGLDTDPLGNLWFGKWRWNADDGWENPAAIDDAADNIVRSMVSPEGLLYLQTSLGKLLVWGKAED